MYEHGPHHFCWGARSLDPSTQHPALRAAVASDAFFPSHHVAPRSNLHQPLSTVRRLPTSRTCLSPRPLSPRHMGASEEAAVRASALGMLDSSAFCFKPPPQVPALGFQVACAMPFKVPSLLSQAPEKRANADGESPQQAKKARDSRPSKYQGFLIVNNTLTLME